MALNPPPASHWRVAVMRSSRAAVAARQLAPYPAGGWLPPRPPLKNGRKRRGWSPATFIANPTVSGPAGRPTTAWVEDVDHLVAPRAGALRDGETAAVGREVVHAVVVDESGRPIGPDRLAADDEPRPARLELTRLAARGRRRASPSSSVSTAWRASSWWRRRRAGCRTTRPRDSAPSPRPGKPPRSGPGERTGSDYTIQRRDRSRASPRAPRAMFTSSTIWKSYIPTQMKSAPFRNGGGNAVMRGRLADQERTPPARRERMGGTELRSGLSGDSDCGLLSVLP